LTGRAANPGRGERPPATGSARPRARAAVTIRLVPPLALLLLAACGQQDNDPGPGGVTVGEARALDEAAEMLEQQRLPQGEAQDAGASPAEASPAPGPSPAPSASPAG